MEVWYMNGAGNDFMVIDARGLDLNFPELTRKLCAMTGADGFMAIDHSETADFRLHFYNSDGSRGEMCGNGARCICRFAYEKGAAGAQMTVQTDAGPVRGWRLSEEQYRVQLNDPGILDLHRTPEAAYVELGKPGVPHAVVELEALQWQDREALREKAQALRFHPAFPKGANVNFYCRTGPDSIRMLTYERGVEDYTLACGTGTGSIAAALWAAGKLPGGRLTAHNPGGILQAEISREALYLEGPTQITQIYRL